jgi:hypothetical protein
MMHMPATRILALFNLKTGQNPAAYEAWAKATDIPAVRAMASVDDFQVHKVEGLLGSDVAPPYGYIETIDVRDMDQFFAEISTPQAQKIAGEFQSMVDVTFLVTKSL